MRTYQRLVIARGGTELSTVNPSYPHNFLVTNSSTGTLKIGSTGVRYNSLPEVNKTPQTFVPPTFTPEIPPDEMKTEENVEMLSAWPTAKKTKSKKKKTETVADDVPTD